VSFRVPFRGSVAVASGELSRGVLRGPRFRRLFPDVYVAADVPLDHATWCRAAVLYAGHDAVVSGLSALLLYGIDQRPLRDSTIEVSAQRRSVASTDPPIALVRTSVHDADALVRAGVRLTSPTRTAYDLACRLPRVSAISAIDAMTHLHFATIDEIRRYALGRPAGPGCTQVAAVLAQVEPDTESPMESRTRMLLVDGGLPRPEAQVEVYDDLGEFVARLDLGYRHLKVGLEYEGDRHRSKDVFRRDIARGNALRDAGWLIVRVTADDVYRAPVRFVRRVARLLAERRRELRL
jgi:very-short-patch-repair endonuclease